MKSQVDAKSGEEVEPDENGRYRKGSIPYTLFAIGYPEVRRIYDRLGAARSRFGKTVVQVRSPQLVEQRLCLL